MQIVFFLQKEEFLISDTLPEIRLISADTSTDAGIRHFAIDIPKDSPDSQSVWLVHNPHSAASSPSVQTFLLEKSKSWATATIAQWQKTLTKRYCAAAIVIISCCLKEGETKSAGDIKKISRQRIAEPQMRQNENTEQVRDIKYLKQDDKRQSSKALVNQLDSLQAAALHSGSSSIKTSDLSKLEIHTNAAGIMKEKEHLNLDEESSVQRAPQKQLSSKAVTEADDDDDGFYVNRQRSLESREKKESIKRLQYNPRAAQDNDKNFNGIIITEQTELQPLEGESETEGSHANTIENGKQKNSANILQPDFTEGGEEGLIKLFLPDTQMETQTEPASARTLMLNTDTGWKPVHIPLKKLGEPPPMRKDFIIKLDNSICKCLKENELISLEIHAMDRLVGTLLKPAESIAEVSTVSAYRAGQDKGATEKTENTETNNTPHENMSINYTKQEENLPSDESVIRSPPLNKIMETEMMKTEPIAETTTVNMEIKETTSSMEVFNQSSTRKADGLPSTEETSTSTASPGPGTDSEPRRIKCKTRNIDSGSGKLFTGLRMREDILADLMKLHKSEAKHEFTTPTYRPESGRQGDQKDPGGSSVTVSKPLGMIHKQAPDNLHKVSEAAPDARN